MRTANTTASLELLGIVRRTLSRRYRLYPSPSALTQALALEATPTEAIASHRQQQASQ